MNYYALFFDNKGYVEKCLSLIRAISNPHSSSLPHITVRISRETKSNLEYINSVSVSCLNIIEPGTFGLDGNKPPFVVYIRCESEELEGIEYKPDYPFSRLHITLYEGDSIYYAKSLLSLLSKMKWHFSMPFETPLKLIKRRIGSIPSLINDITLKEIYMDVTGTESSASILAIKDDKSRLLEVRTILYYLQKYLDSQANETNRISSHYSNKPNRDSIHYTDASSQVVRYKEGNQLSFEIDYPEKEQEVNKLVCDAIYVTPPEYARDMAMCALEAFGPDSQKIDFGDSAIGTGALFLALKQWVEEINKRDNKHYKFNSAFGIDIDKQMAEESFVRYSKRGLSVIYGDATSSDINLGSPRNLMLVNPPYNRNENIPKGHRDTIASIAQEITGIPVKGDAGLFVYHLLIMDKWLSVNGVASWLLPSIFLQSRYGEAIRTYLLNNVQMLRLHVYDDIKPQFEDTHISTTIITFRKQVPDRSAEIVVSSGDSAIRPFSIRKAKTDEFFRFSSNWRNVVFNVHNDLLMTNSSSKDIRFNDLFDIKRGLATGANSFFVLDRCEAQRLGIPDIAIKPLLPKAKYLRSLIVDAQSDGFPDVTPQLVLIDCDLDEKIIKKKHPQFYTYLQTAKQSVDNAKPITDGVLVRRRKPWYKQETRNTPPFLLTYMGRTKNDRPPLYFILNKSKATALNTYILLYPKPWLSDLLRHDSCLSEQLLHSLNESAKSIISKQTRIYAGGLQKIEPGELKLLPVGDFPAKILLGFKSFNNSSELFLNIRSSDIT